MPAAWRGNRPPRPRVDGVGGRRSLLRGSGRTRCSISDGGHARRRAADRRRNPRTAGASPMGWRWCAGVGSRSTASSCSRIMERFRESSARPARTASAFARGHAVAGRRGCRRRGSRGRGGASPTGRRWSPAPGWPRRLKGLRSPQGLAQIDPGDAPRRAAALPAGGRALAVSAGANSAWAPAWPTIWGSARPSRCSRCCWFCKRQNRTAIAAQPAGGARLAAGQLGGGNRTLRAGSEGADRASLGHARRRTEGPGAERLQACGPGDHQLRLAAARCRGSPRRRWRLAVLDEAQAIKNPDAKQTRAVKTAQSRRPAGAHRHAGGEPPGRSVVDFRFPQPGTAGHAEGVHRISPSAWRAGPTAPTGRCANWCGHTFCGA